MIDDDNTGDATADEGIAEEEMAGEGIADRFTGEAMAEDGAAKDGSAGVGLPGGSPFAFHLGFGQTFAFFHAASRLAM